MPVPTSLPPTPRVAVSMVVWRSSPAQVRTCLESLSRSTVLPGRVMLLCNEDTDPPGTGWDLLPRAGLEVVVVRSAVNLGFAGGHNRLLGELFDDPGLDAVLVLNPDVALDRDAVGQLLQHAAESATPVLAGPLLELASGDELAGEGTVDTAGIVWTRTGRHLDALQGRPLADAPRQPQRVAGVSGACLLVTRAAYDTVVATTGEFFDGDFLAYREDAELGLRGAAVGVDSWLVPSATGRHGRSLRGTTRSASAHVNLLGVRNRFLIRFKYGHRRPGGWLGAPARDVVVLCGVLLRERDSLAGLAQAWRLRTVMKAKGRRIRRARPLR